MEFIYYPNCSTCKKALKKIKDFDPKLRDIVKETPSKEELKTYINTYNKGIKPFFNTSGQVYRQMNLKDKIKDMTIDEACDLLSLNGMLVKRPILVLDNEVLVGYKEREYDEIIKKL